MEVRVKERFTTKLATNRLKWAGYVNRMEEGKLAKRADT